MKKLVAGILNRTLETTKITEKRKLLRNTRRRNLQDDDDGDDDDDDDGDDDDDDDGDDGDGDGDVDVVVELETEATFEQTICTSSRRQEDMQGFLH